MGYLQNETDCNCEKTREQEKERKEKKKFQRKNRWDFIEQKVLKPFLPIVILFLLLTASLIVVDVFYKCKNQMVFNLFYELDKAALITGVLGGFVKVFTENVLSITKKEGKLKDIGIMEIVGGRSTGKQISQEFGLFGEEAPTELKFFFVTGQNYFANHYLNIVTVIAEKGCHVKILLAKKTIDGERNQFLVRMDKFKDENTAASEEEKEKSSEKTKALRAQDDPADPAHIYKLLMERIKDEEFVNAHFEVREYIDEYRLSLHIACYGRESKKKIRVWSDIIPPTLTSFKFSEASMTVSEYDPEKDIITNNYAYGFDDYFQKVWNMHEHDVVDYKTILS